MPSVVLFSGDRRVRQLMRSSGRLAYGGEFDADTRYIEPTVLEGVTPADPIMQEEIFGPVLPIVEIASADQAIDIINSRSENLIDPVCSVACRRLL